MTTVNEGVMLDIMRAYQQMRATPRSTYPKLGNETRFKMKNVMDRVNALVNQQLMQMQSSYSNSSGLLLTLAEVNQCIGRNDLYGSIRSLSEFYNGVKTLNSKNRIEGNEEILEPSLIEEIGGLCSIIKSNNIPSQANCQAVKRRFICG